MSGCFQEEQTQLSKNFSINSVSETRRPSIESGVDYFSKVNEQNEQHDQFIMKKIAVRENKFVTWSRLFFILALLISGSIITFVAHLVGLNAEKNAMRKHFALEALELIELSEQKVLDVFMTLDTLSVTITSFANQNSSRNEGQPPGFYTLPDVEHLLGTARNVSRALMIAYLPLVKEKDRKAWEFYSRENQDWILDANGLEKTNDFKPIYDTIWSHDSKEGEDMAYKYSNVHDEPKGNGPYSPVWQRSPPVQINETDIINYNMFNQPVFEKAFKFTEYTRSPVFLDVCEQTAWFGARESGVSDPQTVVIQPVFEDFNSNSSIVGVLAAVLPWNIFFDDILSNGTDPVHLVMSNTCDEKFSYVINGSHSQYSEMIDVHHPKYDNQGKHKIFADFANPLLPEKKGFEYCVYTINIYPTQEMEDTYRGNESIVYAMVIMGIFLFTSFAFTLYDYLVRLRQKKVLSTANETQVLVSSLFPETVQDQVLVAVNKQKNLDWRLPKNDRLAATVNTNISQDDKDHDSIAYALKHTKPIANLYPETTIMFADIAGFTKWSSSRSPTEVFTLLETLYHAFDTIARKRGVFKVETIGDCYVAVCGLPHARSDHYAVMACFAIECMQKIKEVVQNLQPILGVDTKELELRAGLHSGAVTAGVLRGEKARFQLFGDTMNTASRMESTGLKGRIQCSQEVADLLIASGKSKWIAKREEKVIAKGKGELSTFWLQIDSVCKINH